eukprot:g16404.t1
MIVISVLLLSLSAVVDGHGYLTCPKPRQYRNVKPASWTNWVGITVPGDGSFALGEGNAANSNAGIGGGAAGAALELSQGHGLCGDIGTRRGFMAGGAYGAQAAKGVFEAGDRMAIDVKISAYHAGWFEFRLCVPTDGGANYNLPETLACFNQHVLEIHPDTPGYPSNLTKLAGSVLDYAGMKGISGGDGGWYKCANSGGWPDPTSKTPNTVWPAGTCCNNGGVCSDPLHNRDRYITEFGGSGATSYKVVLRAPAGIACERCVLQWAYITANSRETYPETFWNCADVKVVPAGNSAGLALGCAANEAGASSTVPPSTMAPVTTTLAPVTTLAPSGSSTMAPVTTQPPTTSAPSTSTGSAGSSKGPYWCSTTWNEYGNGKTATCYSCSTSADCPGGRQCWGSSWCKEGVLCGASASCKDQQNSSPSTTTTTTTTTTTAAPGTTSASASTSTAQPSSTSIVTTAAPPATSRGKKLVAYVANWQQCPTDEVLSHYTHVMIAFAVTYTWDPNGNQCDAACNLKPVAGCANSVAQLNGNVAGTMVARAHALGVKVLLSVGGAGMGGSWNMATDRCWDPCLDKAQHLADQVAAVVRDNKLDGVDVDYEDILNTQQRQQFLRNLTLALRTKLNALSQQTGKAYEISHTPMDSALSVVPSGNQQDYYYQVLNTPAMIAAVNYLMPQYYNGYMSVPTSAGAAAAITHYGQLVNGLFAGDASRVLFGFCINDCSSFNVNAARAVQVVGQLQQTYPSNGGSFFWSSQAGDLDGAWSKSLVNYYSSLAPATTIIPATQSPVTTQPPVTTQSPPATTQSPSPSTTTQPPAAGACQSTPLSAWNACTEAAKYNCCPAGYGCYRQDQWYAQCIPVGQCSWGDCTCLGSGCATGGVRRRLARVVPLNG